MYNLGYEHDQYLILALGGGTFLVLLIVLAYVAAWRPRPPQEEQPRPASDKALRHITWVLAVVYIVIAISYFLSPFIWLYWPEHW